MGRMRNRQVFYSEELVCEDMKQGGRNGELYCFVDSSAVAFFMIYVHSSLLTVCNAFVCPSIFVLNFDTYCNINISSVAGPNTRAWIKSWSLGEILFVENITDTCPNCEKGICF